MALHSLPYRRFPYLLCISLALPLVTGITLHNAVSQKHSAPLISEQHPDPPTGWPPRTLRLISLGLLALLILWAALSTPIYNVNDDLAINCLLGGYFRIPAGVRPLFMNTLLGAAIFATHHITDTVPCYGLLMFAGLGAGCWSCLSWFETASPKLPLFIGASVTFLTCVAAQTFTELTFTLVGEILTLGGILAFASAARMAINRPSGPTRRQLNMAALLLFGGSLFRFEGFLLICTIAIPSLLVYVACTLPPAAAPTNRSQLLRVAGRLLTVLLISAFFELGDAAVYRMSPDWGTWPQRHQLMARITNYYQAELLNQLDQDTHSVRPETNSGWSRSEVRLISLHFYLDQKFRSPESVQRLQQLLKKSYGQRPYPELWQDFEKTLLIQLSHDPVTLRVYVLIGFLAALSCFADARIRGPVLFTVLWTGIILTAVGARYKMVPYRVAYGVAATDVALLLGFLLDGLPLSPRPRMRYASAVFLICMAAFSVTNARQQIAVAAQRRIECNDFVTETKHFMSYDEPFVVWYPPNRVQPAFANMSFLKTSQGTPAGYLAATPPAGIARSRMEFGEMKDVLSKKRSLRIVTGINKYPQSIERDLAMFQEYFQETLGNRASVSVEEKGQHYVTLRATIE
ncbi:MAG: hypothetical protein KDA96_13060 [Planctomycetaceae bacterium]|nr:hypothetical protein [Planctomycetaceae bacterium]